MGKKTIEHSKGEVSITQELKLIKDIFDNSEERVYVTLGKYDIVYMNKAMKSLIGEKGVGGKCYHVLRNNENPCEFCYLKNLTKNKTLTTELEIAEKPFKVVSKFLDNNLRITFYKNTISINEFENELEKKHLELISTKNKYQEIVENTSEWIWELDVNGNFTFNNSIAEKITGYTSEELLGKNIFDNLTIKNIEEHKANFLEKVEEKEGWTDLVLSYYGKSGDIFTIESSAICIVDTNKNVIGFRGINRDITSKIKTELELKKLYKAVEQSASSIVITDIDGNIEYVNPAFCKITGYSLNEVKGNNPRVLKSGFQNDTYYDELWETISNGKTWKGEIQNKRKNGTYYWEQMTITPITDDTGTVVNYMAIKENITQIKENEQILTSFINSVPDVVCYLDGKGKWLLANNSNLKLFGLQNVDYVGKTYAELANYTHEIYKDLFKKFNESDEETWEKKTQTSSINIIPTIDGTNKVFEVIKIPSFYQNGKRKGLALIARDITLLSEKQDQLEKQHKQLTAITKKLENKNLQLSESNNKYFELFEYSPVAMWEEDYTAIFKIINSKNIPFDQLESFLDKNYNFLLECLQNLQLVSVNQKALELFDVNSQEEFEKILGSNLSGEKLISFKETILTGLSNNVVFEKETEIVHPLDKNISAILKVIFDKDTNRAIVAVVDITTQKESERALIKHNKELEKAKLKIQESDTLKTEFLNNMSHEIRTPMNGILGFTQLLNNPELTSEKREKYIKIINNSSQQLMRILDDILEISRLGTKQVTLIEKEICLNDLIFDIFSIYESKAKERNLSLYINKSLNDEESIIKVDESKLNKILSNLVENALKFTNEGFIEIGYKVHQNILHIYVKDTGVGINKEMFTKIFDRFAQEEKVLSKKAGGLGLGLSIAKENAQLLGGEILVESVKGKGSTFTLKIPFKPINSSVTIKSSDCYTILIAEDEEINYLYLETLINNSINEKYTLLHAKNGEDAIKLVDENPTIDLILMDIKMPIMNGIEAAKHIKKHYPTIPIIAQSAFLSVNEEEISECFDDFIAKPITEKAFLNSIKSYFNI